MAQSFARPSANGVVGIKPTAGLLDGHGIIPITTRQDTAGAIGRTVEDAVILLDGLAAHSDANSLHSQLNKDDLRGLVLGYVLPMPTDSDSQAEAALFAAAVAELQRAGAKPVVLEMRNVDPAKCDILTVLLSEMHRDLGAYLSATGSQTSVHSLEDLVAFDQITPGEKVASDADQISAAVAHRTTDAAYKVAMQGCEDQAAQFAKIFDDLHLDAFLAITTDGLTALSAFAGSPHLTVPIGFIRNKVPSGLTVFGRRQQEATIIKIAYGFDEATGGRLRRNPPTP